ncbi:hypothetical protein BEH94_00625 [Candidatus Altiarchaeales archaeon WOR_SM1_SCG]|nr:hypothetical protein BEH94_00625 [Candidatus Altiarchaeales archaeon WOR_SM1_SCG]
MMYKHFYHLTTFNNTLGILEKKVLIPGRGEYDEKQVCIADFLSQYLEDFGNVCFEFNFENLFAKNYIYPFDYEIEEQYFYLPDGFPAMPFWECEWQSERVEFEYNDINKMILFSNELHSEEIKSIADMLNHLDIAYKIMDFSELPEPDFEFFIRRYLKRKLMFTRQNEGNG